MKSELEARFGAVSVLVCASRCRAPLQRKQLQNCLHAKTKGVEKAPLRNLSKFKGEFRFDATLIIGKTVLRSMSHGVESVVLSSFLLASVLNHLEKFEEWKIR